MMRNRPYGGRALPAVRFVLLLIVVALAAPVRSQPLSEASPFNNVTWRNVGPFQGGRATTGVGVPGDKQRYYMGSTGGGVWESANGGRTWNNISDKYFRTGSIGDIAIFAADPKVIYVGTGEAPVRGQMSSYGDGVYKSTDAGKTWVNVGLQKTMQISRVIVHPTNPNLVYVAAQGNRWIPSEERGIYRSNDGGVTWKRILFSSKIAGASDLQMDPYDPNVLYAGFWDFQRFPWAIRSGGPGSGIWKTTDGGEHWMQLKTGLPKLMGKVRIAVSAANDNRIYAAIESEKSGLFRSDDAGMTWTEVNEGGGFATRPWYYLGVTADPKSLDTLYVSGASLLKSTDGGKTFAVLKTRHGDTHTLWINPTDPRNMIDTDDGGAEVSFDAGGNWSPIDNQPTAQLYTVRVDDLFPYNLYSGQQDSSAVRVASRVPSGRDGPKKNWREIASNEAARVAFDPKNPRVVYTSNYQGTLTRTDMDTGIAHDVSPWPGQKLGTDAEHMTYRFDWSPPVIGSPFDSNLIYLGANVLFRTHDQGQTWEVISPDLTRNEKAKHGRSGLWWHDGSGGEIYNTIYAVAESPLERGTLWVGTGDGLVQLTRDNGKTWKNVTPKSWGEGWVYTVEPSHHDPGTAYVTLSHHRTGDMHPHIYKTADFGKTWVDLAGTLPQDAPARVVREDPKDKDLLFAATEYDIWVSFDGGNAWQTLQQNLPHVPMSDLAVHDDDLIVSTEGRGFWVLDDITTFRQLSPPTQTATLTLFEPRKTYRMAPASRGNHDDDPGPSNPPAGVILRYYLPQTVPKADTLKLEILDDQGALVRSYSSAAEPSSPHPIKSPVGKPEAPVEKSASTKHPAADRPVLLATDRGLDQAVWDMRRSSLYEDTGEGPLVPSGHYRARLSLGSTVTTQSIELTPDPRTDSTPASEKDRATRARRIMEVMHETNGVFNELRDVLVQVDAVQKQAKGGAPKSLDKALASFALELETFAQRFKPKTPSGPGAQGVLTSGSGPVGQFGPVLTAIEMGSGPITQGDRLRAQEVEALCVQLKEQADHAMNVGIPKINTLIAARGLTARITRHAGVAAPPADNDEDDDLDTELE
jgi:photosystem II stability/assembly factor-like uncharacterized protein